MEIKPIVRDENGLIKGIEYFYTSEGLVDWRKMVKTEYLVPNKQYFEKQNKPVPATIEGLQDKELLILLAGIKNLARVRGYSSVHYNVTSPSADSVFVVCTIGWLPNYETEKTSIYSSGIGDAHPNNTKGIGTMFLGPIAENRAFVRCVRNFLNVNVIGQDEISVTKPDESDIELPIATASPHGYIEHLMNEKKVTFDMLKAKMLSMGIENAKSFKNISDIPKEVTYLVVEALRLKKN